MFKYNWPVTRHCRCKAAHAVAERRTLVGGELEVAGVGGGDERKRGEPARHEVIRNYQTFRDEKMELYRFLLHYFHFELKLKIEIHNTNL